MSTPKEAKTRWLISQLVREYEGLVRIEIIAHNKRDDQLPWEHQNYRYRNYLPCALDPQSDYRNRVTLQLTGGS